MRNKCIPEQPDLVDFLFVVDISWNYDMSNAWFQESSDWKLWHDGACHMCFFMNWFIVSGIRR